MNPFTAIAESTYDWESWVSDEGKLLWTNPAAERITGYSVAECLAMGDYPLALVSEQDRSKITEVLEEARAGISKNHVEFRILRKDGSTVWGAISFQPLVTHDGTTHGYRSSVREIDEQKKLEQALVRAMHEADQANRAKTQFLANVSHELKTPLQAIMGLAELVERESPQTRSGSFGKTIFQQAELLERLVTQLLDYAALESDELPLSLETIDVQVLLERTLMGLLPMALGRGAALSWNIDGNISLLGDRAKISQVLINLVGNSMKFAIPGPIEVSVKQDDEYLVIAVDDAGPGVKNENLIFRPFVQESVDENGHKADGVGLGLAICKQITERLGGGITYRRSKLGGARFEARFSCRLKPTQEKPAAGTLQVQRDSAHSLGADLDSPQSVEPKNERVLVVDDTPSVREAVCALMESLGCVTEVAASAAVAVEKAKTYHFDLILVDLQMPGVDGFNAGGQLKNSAKGRPYLVATSAASYQVTDDALRAAGFHCFSPKPMSRQHLSHLLKQARAHHDCELFNRERWRELAAIDTIEGTLLRRMQRRVGEQLPVTETELRTALERHDDASAKAALHTLSGLFGLIGAESARKISVVLEERVAQQEQLALDEYRPIFELSARVGQELSRYLGPELSN